MIALNSLYRYFITHPEGQWVITPENAKRLYNLVKEIKPKRVLDLGTGIGCSASIIALALKENGGDFHIDSIEQYDKCISLSKTLIPKELQEHITIHKSNAVIWETPHIPYIKFSIYETLPDGDWDLILNDGPAPWNEGEKLIELSNGTIHKMVLEDKLKPGTYVAYDGRIESIKLLERHFSNNFYCIKPTRKGSDFNVLQRKNNQPLPMDEKYLLMRDTTTYFKTPNKPKE